MPRDISQLSYRLAKLHRCQYEQKLYQSQLPICQCQLLHPVHYESVWCLSERMQDRHKVQAQWNVEDLNAISADSKLGIDLHIPKRSCSFCTLKVSLIHHRTRSDHLPHHSVMDILGRLARFKLFWCEISYDQVCRHDRFYHVPPHDHTCSGAGLLKMT